MADHLQLPQPVRLESRRAGTGFGERPARVPGRHGRKLNEDLDQAITSMRPARTIEGVDPAYVFKIRAAGPLQESALRGSGLQFLGDTKEWTYFVLAPGDDPAPLRKTLGEYRAAGDRAAEAPRRTFFDSIEEFLPYGRDDRRGPGIPADGDAFDAPIAVDVIVWPSTNVAMARVRVNDVRLAVAQSDAAAVLTADERARYTVVRARVDRLVLDDLLDLPVVERIRVPPAPRLEPSTWRNTTIDDLPTPRVETVAPMGLIDDEVMEHPLLPAGIIASRAAVPADHAWLPPSDHGTLVAGLYAYGDIEDALAGGSEWVAYGPIHAVRVLEPDPRAPDRTRFPTDQPAYRVIETAIRDLNDKYGVRVFNLSVTDDAAYSGPHVSVWTERLDDLARELDAVIVVAAGNQRPDDLPPQTDLLTAYPSYLLADGARVAEPAIAANTITVGSIAHADAPQTLDGTSRPGDRAIAKPAQPSPFTRTGPGAADAIKPDLVERGGNWVLDDIDRLRDPDHGVSVISLVRRDQRLFGVANGTSFAAPRVARLAAAVLHRYPYASANLVRALLGVAAVPIESPDALDAKDLRRIAGHGYPKAARALDSQGPRVAMTFEGTIAADTAVIHPVTIPEEFARGGSSRSIAVALAFDPEVRRTRREYLAGRMSFDLVRNMSIDDIKATWVKQPDDKALRLDLPGDRRRPKLEPGMQDSRRRHLLRRRPPHLLGLDRRRRAAIRPRRRTGRRRTNQPRPLRDARRAPARPRAPPYFARVAPATSALTGGTRRFNAGIGWRGGPLRRLLGGCPAAIAWPARRPCVPRAGAWMPVCQLRRRGGRGRTARGSLVGRAATPSVTTVEPGSTLSTKNARSESADPSASSAIRQRPNPLGAKRSTATPTRAFLPLARPPMRPRSSPPMYVSSTPTVPWSARGLGARARSARGVASPTPSDLIGADLKRSLHAQRRDPVLLGGELPAGGEPDRQRRARTVKDRAGRG